MLALEATAGESEGGDLGSDCGDVTIRPDGTQRDNMSRTLHTTNKDVTRNKTRCVDGKTSDGMETVGLGQGLHMT